MLHVNWGPRSSRLQADLAPAPVAAELVVADRGALVADKLGQHLWGRWQSDEFCRIGQKISPGIFETIKLTGAKSLRQTT